FFFQAEDGIRDFHVTGVQTCALPILAAQREPIEALRRRVTRGERAARLTGARDELDNRLADRAELQREVEGAHEELERWQAQLRSEERRVGKRVDRGGRRVFEKDNQE